MPRQRIKRPVLEQLETIKLLKRTSDPSLNKPKTYEEAEEQLSYLKTYRYAYLAFSGKLATQRTIFQAGNDLDA